MATTTSKAALQALAGLGFSEIEARVYAYLLSGPPATGYRVSHAIGKPTANTYKAIQALQDKGALLVDEGANKLCRAVPPGELLAALERRFQQQRGRAEDELSRLHRPESDDRIYQFTSVDQVFERAETMLGQARKIVLLDVFPAVAARLGPALRAVAGRGVEVVAKIYAPLVIPAARLVAEPSPERALAEWPGQQLSLVVDAEEHLLALFSPDLGDVRQAVWSPSLFLSSMHHNHLASEILVTLQDAVLAAGGRTSPRSTSSSAGSRGESATSPELVRARAALEDARRITVLRSRPPGMTRLQELYSRTADPLADATSKAKAKTKAGVTSPEKAAPDAAGRGIRARSSKGAR